VAFSAGEPKTRGIEVELAGLPAPPLAVVDYVSSLEKTSLSSPTR